MTTLAGTGTARRSRSRRAGHGRRSYRTRRGCCAYDAPQATSGRAAIFKETVTIEVTEPAVDRLREAAAVAADAATELLADPANAPGVPPGAGEEEARAHAQRAIDRARFVHDQFGRGAPRVTVALPLEVLTGLVQLALQREERELALALDPAQVRDRSRALVALISLRSELDGMQEARVAR